MSDAFRQAHISILEQTSGTTEIYEALGSDDLADVVRAARRSLNASGFTRRRTKQKSAEASYSHRNQSNVHYKNGEYKDAILCYNKALAFAPINSLEMKLAYANTSAVMLSIKAYQPCQANIAACYELGCPNHLKKKLNKRMEETYKNIMGETMVRAQIHRSPEINNFVAFEFAKNDDITCASQDITVETNDGGLKKVVAARNIKSGKVVAMEQAFVSTQTEENLYTSCYYCQRICLCFVPCEGCCVALFCTKECRNKCMQEYHQIECQIIEYLEKFYNTPVDKLMTRTAINLSLQLGWDQLSVVSREMGKKRYKKSSVKETFDSSILTSILSYDDEKYMIQGKIFNGSIICAIILNNLSLIPDYFPKDHQKNTEAIDAMSRIMLHLCSTFTNNVEILCSTLDYKNNSFKCGAQRNFGWFSFASKLTHSCEPNLFVLGLNNRVALVTLQRIRKGEELTISYIDHFYDYTLNKCATNEYRKVNLIHSIQHYCDCRVCTHNWDSTSQVNGDLTESQRKVFQKMVDKTACAALQLKASAAALDALTGSINTVQHKIAFGNLRSALHICQVRYIFNMAYDTKLL